ncbi:MAG: Glu-tRNA(Gln) amidotransferase subunit GatE [Candidatus Diapherotrites archaeon]
MPKLKCGLEVHQQLNTGKLHCRCPSLLHEEAPERVVRRKIRAVAGELGQTDAAAREAFLKGTTFAYEAFDDCNCLVDLDEEPPQSADSEAVDIALQIALMSHCLIPPKLQTMRKTVVDGSNVSGFQRTTLMGTDGWIEVSGKKYSVLGVILEEDAARPVRKDEARNEIVYRLDRLGIPLIEFATGPEISSPSEAKAVALAIGQLFRLTGKARRGLGTIRQDLNISIEGGARIELKGVQDLDKMDLYVEREMERQEKLLEVKDALLERGVSEKTLKESQIEEIPSQNAGAKLLQGKRVFFLRLPHCKDYLGKEIQPARRVGTEIAGYVKARAGLKGFIHSDENLSNYGFSSEFLQLLSSKVQASDAWALVAENNPEKAKKALETVRERCIQLLKGIPEETRNALEDGNSEYSRPLPGAARMYPETDLALVDVPHERLKALEKKLPKSLEERMKDYLKLGLSKQVAENLKLSNFAPFFEKMVAEKVEAKSAAWLLLEGLTQLKRERVAVEKISEKMLEEALKAKIPKESVLGVLSEWSRAPHKSLAEIRGETLSSAELDKLVLEIVRKNEKFVKEKGTQAIGALMGELMREAKGKISGKQASEALKKAIEKS